MVDKVKTEYEVGDLIIYYNSLAIIAEMSTHPYPEYPDEMCCTLCFLNVPLSEEVLLKAKKINNSINHLTRTRDGRLVHAAAVRRPGARFDICTGYSYQQILRFSVHFNLV